MKRNRIRTMILAGSAVAILGPAAMAQFGGGGTRFNGSQDTGPAYLKPGTPPCQAIDFESFPTGPTSEGDQVGTQYSGHPFYVTFSYPSSLPRIAKVGAPRVAFDGPLGTTCSGFSTMHDMPDPNQPVDYGCSFLTDDGALNSAPPILTIAYGIPTHQTGGRLLDLDLNGNDKFEVRALGLNKTPIPGATVLLDGPSGVNTGNGYGSLWYFDSATPIYFIEIEFVGSGNQVGWGMDNFYPHCLPCDTTDQRIDFESIPDGSAPTETMEIGDQWNVAPYFVRFERADGQKPRLAQVGSPRRAFGGPNRTSCGDTSGDDMPAAGTDFGCFFLTDDTSSVTDPIPLIIHYEVPVQRCSGYILDVDQTEAWTVTAHDKIGNLLMDFNQPVSVQMASPPAQDGLGTYWSFDTTGIQQAIYSIHITYTGPSYLSVGLAFDNFSFCRSGAAPSPSGASTPNSLQLGDGELSMSQGGHANLFLDAPFALSGQPYLMIATLTHPAPMSCSTILHSAGLVKSGRLDINGRAQCEVELPTSQAGRLVGHDLVCGYWVPGPSGGRRFVSNRVTIPILP